MSQFIRKITLRNYKSIASCKIELPRLSFLIGPNGSGKSNFLDSFRFVSDGLKTSLDHALRDRGTIKEVRRRSGGHPNHFSIRLDFNLPARAYGHLSFRIGARKDGGFEVQTKSNVETKNDGKDFQRFDDLLRKVVSVPKKEIEKREKKKQKKNTSKRTST